MSSSIHIHFFFYMNRERPGAGSGGGAPVARRPPKIGKNMIFLALNRDFSHEIPQKFSRLPPLGAIFFNMMKEAITWQKD